MELDEPWERTQHKAFDSAVLTSFHLDFGAGLKGICSHYSTRTVFLSSHPYWVTAWDRGLGRARPILWHTKILGIVLQSYVAMVKASASSVIRYPIQGLQPVTYTCQRESIEASHAAWYISKVCMRMMWWCDGERTWPSGGVQP